MIYFTKKEIEATGARFEDVQPDTLERLDTLRSLLACKVYLQANGLTSGNHQAKEHPQGKAVDFRIVKNLSIQKVIEAALDAGFRGIGVYPRGQYHVDTRPAHKFWRAEKLPGSSKWAYFPLLDK